MLRNIKFKEIHANQSVEEVRRIMQRACGWYDVDAPGRDLWVMPIPGANECAAGFTITINGSPPRGCLLVRGSDEYHVYFDRERLGGGVRRCRPKDGRVVLAFLASHGFTFGRPIDMESAVFRWQRKGPAKKSPQLPLMEFPRVNLWQTQNPKGGT